MFFPAEGINEYRTGEEPDDLRIYASSDFAIETKQHSDCTCHLIVGVDSHENIWLLDCWWHKLPADKIVESMLKLMQDHKPITWWAESGHISKSIGPFLYKRMRQTNTFCAIEEVSVQGKSKQARAQSIKGYMAMGKVYFPRDKHWYGSARQQILKFGGGSRYDDFVDSLSLIGLGLQKQVGKRAHTGYKQRHTKGTFGAFKDNVKRQTRRNELMKESAGF
jgi:predicted phage terminase large subunit-like protein